MDVFANFAAFNVSTGYDAAATSIDLAAGGGARMPGVSFNATWWNATDYPDPSDDPNREIVRVTAIAGDTLTITRAQEGTAASTKNTAAKTYRLAACVTATTLNTELRSASNLNSGTLPAGRMPALTGDVTTPGASLATTIANNAVTTAKVANDQITYAKLQDISATARVLGRKSGGTGDTEECTLTEILDFIGGAAQGDLLYRGAANWARLGAGTIGQRLKTLGAGANPAWADDIATIASAQWDGGGSALVAASAAIRYYRVKGDWTITGATILADQSGSAVVDVWKDTYANYPPTVADTITAAAKPTLAAAIKNEDNTLTGWTVTVSDGDILGFKVDSCATVTWLLVQIHAKKR